MDLSEAEIQLLAVLFAAEQDGGDTDRDSLEARGEAYAEFHEDWTQAYDGLQRKGLVGGDDTAYSLTDAGREPAQGYYAERPDRYYYYYLDFYRRAQTSDAHSELCRRVFGLDLTQEGQMDMDGLHDLLARLALKPGEHLLDLGCGAGGIAEYLADHSGARVTGLDYSAAAIEVARERTKARRDQVDFVRGDLNAIDLPAGQYDAAVMIDSVYWIDDTANGLGRILRCLRPGGRLLVAIAQALMPGDDPAEITIDGNFVARALDTLGVDYQAVDLTDSFLPFWQRMGETVEDLRDTFIAEGNESIYQSLSTEARDEFLPAIEAGALRRFLYLVRT